MTTSTLLLPVSGEQDLASWAAVAFVASYSSPGTRQAYTTQLRLWFAWCAQHQLEPLADVRRPHVELYARDLEARGLAPATVALKLVVLTGFYRYCIEEQLLEHSPAVHVRRPKVSQESTRLCLDRTELGAFLVQAGLSGGTDHALACLLALNALRVSEACGAGLSDLALANGHRVVRIVGKGNQPALIPLAPRTARRITAALDAGCSLRDVQDFARHADPRQTRRYALARGALELRGGTARNCIWAPMPDGGDAVWSAPTPTRNLPSQAAST